MQENKATLNPNVTVTFVQWKDNCSEVKRFCGNSCIITYETCAVEDYWLLKVLDYLKGEHAVVPVGHYVVKLNGKFTVLSPHLFRKLFNVED